MHIQFEVFHSIEILFLYIFIDYILFDFWCAFDILKMKCLKTDFSLKSEIFI